MLCKADFEELFPELFEQQPRAAATQTSVDCVARWEDDGGAPAVLGRNPTKPWPVQAASPMMAALLGLAAIHSAMQFGKVAMPPARRMLDVIETR